MSNLNVNSYFMAIFSIFVSFQTLAGQIFYEPLKVGQCQALPETKKYITDVKVQQIVKYKCQYDCLNNLNKIEKIWIEHETFLLANDDSMESLSCSNVKVDLKRSELGYVLDQNLYVSSFWAKLSTLSELKEWTKQNQITLPSDVLEKRITDFQKILFTMGQDLLTQKNQTEIIKDFAYQLVEIGSNSEAGKILLKNSIQKINSNTPSDGLAEALLISQIKYHGWFLLQ